MGISSASTKSIAQKNKVKQGVSWGVEELTVSGYIEAREGESSPKPQGTSSFVQGAGSRSSPKPRGGQGVDCRGGGGTDNSSPLGKSKLLLDELPGKDGVGDPFPGSLRLKSGGDIVGQPDGDPGGASSFGHSVGHYSQSYGKSQPGDYLDIIAKRSELGPGQVKQGLWSPGQKTLDGQVVYPLEELDDLQRTADQQSIPSQWPLPFEGKQLELACPGWAIVGSCENGHRYAKELYCGREWCEVCGAEWSAAHQRRFSRWISKATQINSLGYFVFTIPEALRSKYRTKKALGVLGHQVQELLKSYGYSRGLRRWHFFGDKSTKWNPHLNVIVDGGYLHPRKLDLIKVAYAGLLEVDLAVVNYRFQRLAAKKVHILKYVTRATFLDYHWDSEMALEIHGFRNQLWWGSKLWDSEPSWSLDELEGAARESLEDLDALAVENLESGICPKCGQPIDWSRPFDIRLLRAMDKRSLGGGYWELPAVRSPPGLPDEVEQRLYWMELVHRVEIRMAQERAAAEMKAEVEESQGWWASLLLTL